TTPLQAIADDLPAGRAGLGDSLLVELEVEVLVAAGRVIGGADHQPDVSVGIRRGRTHVDVDLGEVILRRRGPDVPAPRLLAGADQVLVRVRIALEHGGVVTDARRHGVLNEQGVAKAGDRHAAGPRRGVQHTQTSRTRSLVPIDAAAGTEQLAV